MAAHTSQHKSLALSRSGAEDNNGRENNMLSSRMKTPLHHFNGFSNYDSNEEDDVFDEEVTLLSVKLPFVEQLPRSITWIFTDRHVCFYFILISIIKHITIYITHNAYIYIYVFNIACSNQLMAKIDSVIGKKQIYYVDGEAVELSVEYEEDEEDEENEEDTEKEKCEFSKDVDRFIWLVFCVIYVLY